MMFGNIAPAFSMGPRRELRNSLNVPGPGNYERGKEFFKESTHYSFSKAPRGRQLNRTSPGPGEYDAFRPFYHEASKSSFSRSSRMRQYKTNQPGPGSYDFSVYDKPSPPRALWSKSSRAPHYLKSHTPGPGAYESNHINDTPWYKFAHSQRLPFKPPPVPGPGSYEAGIIQRRERKPLITPRLSSVFKNSNPGPGYYEIPTTLGLAGLRSLNSRRV